MFDDNNNRDIISIPNSSFEFSAVKPDLLESPEYTLTSIAVDTSGSVNAFANSLLEMQKAAIKGCKKSPREENILLRLTQFNSQLNEIHGFVELPKVDPDAYPSISCGGGTALYDATYEAIAATLNYSKSLINQDYSVNSIVYIITDGDDNDSRVTPAMIKKLIEDAVYSEIAKSMVTVLIGINADQYQSKHLAFQKEAGLTHYINIGDVTPSKLAKLGGFISKSVSSQSVSLQTGTNVDIQNVVF